jgi:hypothetical protein
MFDEVKVGLKPLFDSDFHPGKHVSEPFEQLLVSNGLSVNERVLEILQKWVLVAHLDQILNHLVSVEEVLWAFQVVLGLVSEI